LVFLLFCQFLSLSFFNKLHQSQTASATNRFREIGIKKTMGFNRRRLWFQFMLESMSLTVAASLTGIFIAQLALPSLNNMIGWGSFPNILENPKLIFIILAVTLITGFLSGIHPAYIISSYNPVAALKQKFILKNQMKP
jgi:putative ABC transport system permease protein